MVLAAHRSSKRPRRSLTAPSFLLLYLFQLLKHFLPVIGHPISHPVFPYGAGPTAHISFFSLVAECSLYMKESCPVSRVLMRSAPFPWDFRAPCGRASSALYPQEEAQPGPTTVLGQPALSLVPVSPAFAASSFLLEDGGGQPQTALACSSGCPGWLVGWGLRTGLSA